MATTPLRRLPRLVSAPSSPGLFLPFLAIACANATTTMLRNGTSDFGLKFVHWNAWAFSKVCAGFLGERPNHARLCVLAYVWCAGVVGASVRFEAAVHKE